MVRFIFYKILHGEVIHPERLENRESCLIAVNHISWLDPPLVGSLIPGEISVLAKAELFKNKFFGSYLRKLNAIPLRRGTIDRKAIKKAEENLSNNISVMIFPEGSRHNFTARPGIGKMAYETRKNILPIYIENSDHPIQCMLGKKKLRMYVGKVISIEPYLENGDKKENFRKIASDTLDIINGLKNED